MSSKRIRVAIADDHLLFRKVLADYLSQENELQIAVQCKDASELLDQLTVNDVDVAIVDLFMPRANIFDAIKFVKNQFPHVRMIILSMCTDISIISNLLDLGIHAYLSKAEEPTTLIKAIHSVAEDKVYRNHLFTEALFSSIEVNARKTKTNPINVGDRERKIIQLLWDEKSNQEIADEIYLSIRSVEKIRQDLKEKIGFKSIAGLFKYAFQAGILLLNQEFPLNGSC